jgi:hypothetical protein
MTVPTDIQTRWSDGLSSRTVQPPKLTFQRAESLARKWAIRLTLCFQHGQMAHGQKP